MTEQQREHLESILGDSIDDAALALAKDAITPGEDNVRLKQVMEVVAPANKALEETVKSTLDVVVREVMRFATEGFVVFYKEGFYNGINFADEIFEESAAQMGTDEQDAMQRLQSIRDAVNPALDTGIPPLCDR